MSKTLPKETYFNWDYSTPMWFHGSVLWVVACFTAVLWVLLPFATKPSSLLAFTEPSVLGFGLLLALATMLVSRVFSFNWYTTITAGVYALTLSWLSLITSGATAWLVLAVASSVLLYVFYLSAYRLSVRPLEPTGTALHDTAVWGMLAVAALAWLGWYIAYDVSIALAWVIGVLIVAALFWVRLRTLGAPLDRSDRNNFYTLWAVAVGSSVWVVLLTPFPAPTSTVLLLVFLLGWDMILRYSLLRARRLSFTLLLLATLLVLSGLLLTSIPWQFVQ